MEQLYFKGKLYVGEASYINGFNGYTKTEDDSMLCAIINNSCWNKNKKPNYLRDVNGNKIHNENYRGNSINVTNVEKITSRNYDVLFRMVIIDQKKYIVWLNCEVELFKQGKSIILIESVGEKRRFTKKVIDIPFGYEIEKKYVYKMYSKYKKEMEDFALRFHHRLIK